MFLIALTLFSFFYTDKVINIINKRDPLMSKIENIKDNYEILPVNATLDNDTIIPGISGKSVDVEKSYDNMKEYGLFREEYLIYNTLLPSELLANNMDKYIIKGNSYYKNVSIVVVVDNNNIGKISNDKVTLFLNHGVITINNLKNIKDNEVYTYGNNGIYSEDILNNDNLLINRLTNNRSLYCMLKEKDNNMLKICNEKRMFVIIPNIIGDYLEVKNNLEEGSIILVNNISNLDMIINYIEGKGYNIVPLSKLLNE